MEKQVPRFARDDRGGSTVSECRLYVKWRSTLSGGSRAYNFPEEFTAYFRRTYSIPAVYRWRVMRTEVEEKEKIYIGEAEDLVRRIQRVRTPSRRAKQADTNKRLNKLFSRYLFAGRNIVLEIADVEPFELKVIEAGHERAIRFDQDESHDRFKRRALENLLLIDAQTSDQYELLNIFIDPVEKLRRSVMKLPPRQLREFMKILDKRVAQSN